MARQRLGNGMDPKDRCNLYREGRGWETCQARVMGEADEGASQERARILQEAAAWGFGRLKWRSDQKGPQQASIASLLVHGWGRIPEMWKDLPQATQWGSTWEVFISSCIPGFCRFWSGVRCPGHMCGCKGRVSHACWVFSDVQGLALIHFRTETESYPLSCPSPSSSV